MLVIFCFKKTRRNPDEENSTTRTTTDKSEHNSTTTSLKLKKNMLKVDSITPNKLKSTATIRTKPVKKSTSARVMKSSYQNKKVTLNVFQNLISSSNDIN